MKYKQKFKAAIYIYDFQINKLILLKQIESKLRPAFCYSLLTAALDTCIPCGSVNLSTPS